LALDVNEGRMLQDGARGLLSTLIIAAVGGLPPT
jgi:hypothetical protein